MKHKRNILNLIYLTGFMGSGKSTIAPILANILGYSYIDIDNEIEKSEGQTINNIFQEKGELYFRTLEQETIITTFDQNKLVVSLGGGTIAYKNNLQLIKSKGILIYLQTNREDVFKRLRCKRNRPLILPPSINSQSEEEFTAKIDNLLLIREPFYNQSDLIICTSNKKVGTTVDEIVKKLRNIDDLGI